MIATASLAVAASGPDARGGPATRWSQPVILAHPGIPWPTSAVALSLDPTRVAIVSGTGLERGIGSSLTPVTAGRSPSLPVESATVAVSRRGRLLVGGSIAVPVRVRSRARSVVLVGPVAGKLRLADQQPLAGPNVSVYGVGSAINDEGAAVVIFASCRTTTGCRISAITRRAGGAFRRPVPLSAKAVLPGVAVSLDKAGRALVLFKEPEPGTRYARLRWRRMTAGGAWSPAHGLSLPGSGVVEQGAALAATLNDAGRGVVAYQDVGIVDRITDARPLRVRAAEIPLTGRATTPRLLENSMVPADRSFEVTGPRIRAVLDPDGSTTVAWTGIASGAYAIRVQRVPGSAGPATLADGEDLTLQDLTTDAGGRAAIVGTRGPQRAVPSPDARASSVVVSLRSVADAPFGGVSTVFDSADGVHAARGTLNRAGTRLAVIWSSGGASGPSGPVLVSDLRDPFDP